MDRNVEDEARGQWDQVMNDEDKNQEEREMDNKDRDEIEQAMSDEGRGQTRQAMDDQGNDRAVQGIIHEGRNPAEQGMGNEGRDQVDPRMDVENGFQVEIVRDAENRDQVVEVMEVIDEDRNEVKSVMDRSDRHHVEQVMEEEASYQVHQVMEIEDRDQAEQIFIGEGRNEVKVVMDRSDRDLVEQVVEESTYQVDQVMDVEDRGQAEQILIDDHRNEANLAMDRSDRDHVEQLVEESTYKVHQVMDVEDRDQAELILIDDRRNEANLAMDRSDRDHVEQLVEESTYKVHQVMDVEDRDQAELILIDDRRNEAKVVMNRSDRGQVEQVMEEEVTYCVPKVIDVEDEGRAEVLVHEDWNAELVVGNEDKNQARQVMEDGVAKQGERVLDFKRRDHPEQSMKEVVEDGAANQREQMMEPKDMDHPEQSMNGRDTDQAMQGIANEGRAQEEQVKEDGDGEQVEQLKTGPEFISAMLRDGSLSVEGLASKGFYVMEDDDDSEESSSSSSSSDDDTEEGVSGGNSDGASSDSEDENENVPQKKAVQKVKDKLNDLEDMDAPRTKHEIQVLPAVPKVTAALEPHHQTVCVGHITSVLDLTVIVEAESDQRILNEQSVLWMEESRLPLGFVDEIFGPVKNPYYLVRFNESEEIPADAKVGSAVSYVSEFSEFVLKENPELYKRAVDASGMDDEELGSEDEQEFSDDEKEAAARRMNKSKRGNGGGETRPGQAWNKSNGQKTKGTKENVRSGAADAPLRHGVDSTVSQKSASWQSPGPGHLPRGRRHGNHHPGSRSSSLNSDQGQNSRIMGASEATRPADGFTTSPSSMRGEPRHQSTGGAYSPQRHVMQSPGQQTSAQWQTAQGFPIQQQGSIYPPQPYGSVASASQFSPQRQGNPFASSPVSQMHMPATTFNAGMDPSSLAHISGHGLINPSFTGYHPGHVPGPYNRSPIGQGMSAQPGLREMQPGGYPPPLGTGAAFPFYGSAFQPQGFGSQPTGPYTFQSQVPQMVGDGSPFHHDQRGNQPPFPRRNQMDRRNHRR